MPMQKLFLMQFARFIWKNKKIKISIDKKIFLIDNTN